MELSAVGEVYFLSKIGDTVFAGTENGLLVNQSGGFMQCQTDNEPVRAYGFCHTDSHTFFVSDSSVY